MLKTHRERPIPPRAVRELYEHVGWYRPGGEQDMAEVLECGPAVGAWDEDRLVGFVRALSDGHFVAYVEDVMVHEEHRRSGVGEKLMARLMEEIGGVAKVNLFCEELVVTFYEGSGFDRTSYVLMQRTGASWKEQIREVVAAHSYEFNEVMVVGADPEEEFGIDPYWRTAIIMV